MIPSLTPLGASLGHPFPSPLDVVEAKVRRARRWALRAWAVLGLGCLAAGSAYAAGLPSVGGTTGAGSVDAPAVRTTDFSGASAGAPVFSDKITKVADITYTWQQKSASIGTTGMFFVDLASVPAGTYAVEVFLAGALDPAWSAYQLQLGAVPAASSAACAAAAYGTATPKVLYTDTTDSSVLFSGLASGSGYCIGAPASAPSVSTLLRRVNNGVTPAYPTFSALVAKTA
jgi:hypothetical protein